MTNLTQAETAIRAARNYKRWGRVAAGAYCRNHDTPRHLLTIALQLQAVQHFS